MIGSFRHKGLRRFFESEDRKGLPQDKIGRIDDLLAAIDAAVVVEDLALPTFRLHRLKGDLAAFWAVTVRSNWRIIFRFEDGVAHDVDLIDYH